MKQRLLWASVALALALFVAAFRFLSIAGFTNDHYMHMSAGQQIATGDWPLRDFVELGMPLMESLSALPFWLLPQAPLFGEAVLVSVMFALAAVFTLYAVRRLTGSLWISLLVVALEVAIVPRTYSYPKLVAYALGLLVMWRYVERPSLSRMVQLAVVVVAAFGLRYDHGLYLGVGGLLTVVAVALPISPAEMKRKAVAFVAMTLALVSPYVLSVAVYDGLWRHIERGIQLQTVEHSRGRSIPGFALHAVDWSANAVPWLFYVFYLLPVAAAVAAWLRWRDRPDARERAMVVPLIVVAVLVNFGLIRDTLAARLPDAVVPGAVVIGWLLVCAVQVKRSLHRWMTTAVTATVVVLTIASAAAVGETKEHLEKAEMLGTPARLWGHVQHRVAELNERLPLAQIPSRVTARLLPFFEYVDRCVSPQDHILIPGFAPEVTVWSRRPFAGGQGWFQPEVLTDAEDHRRVMNQLQVQRVPVAIMLSPTSEAIAAQFPELGAYLHHHFTETAALEGDDDERVSIQFNPRLAVGRDQKTGWFCYQ